MFTLFLLIFLVFIAIAIAMRFRWTFGEKSLMELAKYVRENETQDTLAAFICSHKTTGNVGLFLSKESIKCSNQDEIVFDIKPEELKRVEYSTYNFFRFITDHHEYKFSYLHDPKEGESLSNNIILTPNLAYKDHEATKRLISVLDSLGIEHIKRPLPKVWFYPYQGSPAGLLLIALIYITFMVFLLLLVNK